MAYSISRIVTEKTDEHTDRLLFYGEPTPESIGPLRGFLDGGGAFQKIILMTTEEHLKEVRPLAVAALGDQAALTTALPGMLEVGVSPRAARACLQKSQGHGVSCSPRHIRMPVIWSMLASRENARRLLSQRNTPRSPAAQLACK